MLRSSIPLGKFMGVDIRIHASFPILLVIAVAFSMATNGHALRGLGLWFALLFAFLSRETARALAAAYAGLRLRALFLLPVGGIMAFSPRDRHAEAQPGTRLVTASGPLANFLTGLLILGAAYAIDPRVSLLAPPWIATTHILRSLIWIQLILGAVSLLPSTTLSSRPFLRARPKPNGPKPAPAEPTVSPTITLGTVLALVMIFAGFLLPNHLWLVVLGCFMLLGAQLGTAQALSSPAADSILVREVMLTEYTLLSTSDTLQGALDRTVHSLQDVFPIVRGNLLVGSVARQTIADRLLAEGDSYLQGVMTRTLQLASPSEKLVDALRRAASLGASEFIPVVEDGSMLGILTPQSLSRAVQHVTLSRPAPSTRDRD